MSRQETTSMGSDTECGLDMRFDDAEEQPSFTCSKCGSQGLRFIHQRRRIITRDGVLTCMCGQRNGKAATRREVEAVKLETAWLFTDGIGWDHEYDHEDEGTEATVEAEAIKCSECHGACHPSLWDWDTEAEIDPNSVRYLLQCSDCGRHVEFDWLTEVGGQMCSEDLPKMLNPPAFRADD